MQYNCVEISSVPICVRYWLEARVNISGQCVSADAAIFSYGHLFSEMSTLFLGSPLRCPVAIALAPGLAVSSVALPEPGTASAGLASLLALARWSIGRTAG